MGRRPIAPPVATNTIVWKSYIGIVQRQSLNVILTARRPRILLDEYGRRRRVQFLLVRNYADTLCFASGEPSERMHK